MLRENSQENLRPLIIAHRGFSSRYPENTIIAMEKAIDAGADGIECDLRLTKDNEIVLFHDRSMGALCSRRGKTEETNWKDLKEIKILNQEPIAHFKDLYPRFSTHWLNLEIKKSRNALRLVDELDKIFRENPPSRDLMISSFSTEILQYAHKKNWGEFAIRLSPIFSRSSDRSFQKLSQKKWAYSWNCHFSSVPKLVKKKEKLEPFKSFWFWTANTRDEWELCLKSGLPVEAFITDHPDRLRKFLQSY